MKQLLALQRRYASYDGERKSTTPKHHTQNHAQAHRTHVRWTLDTVWPKLMVFSRAAPIACNTTKGTTEGQRWMEFGKSFNPAKNTFL